MSEPTQKQITTPEQTKKVPQATDKPTLDRMDSNEKAKPLRKSAGLIKQ